MSELIACTRCAWHFEASEHMGVLGLYCRNCGLFLAVEGSEPITVDVFLDRHPDYALAPEDRLGWMYRNSERAAGLS